MDRVEHVKKLREEYERALDAAESRRSAYHDAVLELYQGGTPLREIAEELGLSHQRVHQIVSGGDPPRRSKLPRAAGGAAAAILILAAATFGALRLAHVSPFTGAPQRVAIPNVVNQPASAAIRQLADAGLQVRMLYIHHKPMLPIQDQVYAQRGKAGEYVARGSTITLYVATQRHVAIRPATRFVALHLGRGFVPGGALLSEGREVISRVSSIGPVSVWVAPDRVSRSGRCSWLQVGQRGSGGSCYQPARRGILQVVPLVLPAPRGPQQTRSLPLIWGRTNPSVVRLTLVFQDGRHMRIRVSDGMFLYVVSVPDSRLRNGHRPAFLVARDPHGRVVDKRPVFRGPLGAFY